MQTRDFVELWTRPELFEAPEVSDGSKYFSAGENGPKPLLLHARSVNGREYTAAAYYGVPKGEPPFPAVILFHGGGGTAFPQYVKKWNRYGYAALIFDHYGKLPVCDLIQYERPHVPGSWLDVEGKRAGIDAELLHILAAGAPIPCVYAGGISSLDDVATIEREGGGRIDYTVGSALDIFGGNIAYRALVDRGKGEKA